MKIMKQAIVTNNATIVPVFARPLVSVEPVVPVVHAADWASAHE